jgi:hypothetical protein
MRAIASQGPSLPTRQKRKEISNRREYASYIVSRKVVRFSSYAQVKTACEEHAISQDGPLPTDKCALHLLSCMQVGVGGRS